MKLYKIANAPAGERWHSAKTGLKDFEEVEMPKGEGRAGLAAFLNVCETETAGAGQSLDELEQAEMRAVEAAKSPAELDFDRRRGIAVARQQDTDPLVAWMLEAKPWQLARVFEAMGERVGELRAAE